MKRQVFFLIVSTVLLASCQREQDWCGAPDINAEVESEQNTRTSISVDESGAGTIYWNPSDKIDVFFGTKKAQYTSQNASDALAATFKTSASLTVSDVSSTNIWGLYPSKSSSSCNGSSITTTLPSTQYGVPDTFDKDIFPAVAHSSSTNLQFYNVCGGIKFNLAYDDIKKITFRDNNNENLAGTVSISFVDDLPKATIVSGVKEITLTPKTGTTFTKGADYYFVLLPGTLSAGFTITFTATDGTTGTLNYTDNPVTIKRSIFGKKGNMDVYAAFADERQPDNVIYYTSTDGSIVTPCYSDRFGVTILSNECVGGKGILLFDGAVTQIGDNAFSNCDNLVSISFPESVTSIGRSVFTYCSNLVSVLLPNGVTTMGDLVFYFCSSLQNVSIPEGVTRIGENAFYRCSSLSSVIIPDGVTSIGKDAFGSCSSLASINIPDGVTSIEMLVFAGCSSLTSIEIPDGVTVIGGYAFSSCIALASIEIPSSVLSIGDYAFSGCTSLATLTLSDGLESIGDASFDRCSSLSDIIIPSSVTSISERAFRSCSGLQSITVLNPTPPSIGTTSLSNTNNCPIYVPAGSVDDYKTAWSRYADRIQAIPDTHEAVDLGLPSGVKWATCNVGASSPDEFGDYYAWGETEPKSSYLNSNYSWSNGSSTAITKYNHLRSNGIVDNRIVLDLADDAAHVNWGFNWRTPTKSEQDELRSYCTWSLTTQSGVEGFRVTSTINGNSIFIPLAGRIYGTSLDMSYGEYWSSTLNSSYHPYYAFILQFNNGIGLNWGSGSRYGGRAIRPVYGEFIPVERVSLDQTFVSLLEGYSVSLATTIAPVNATEKAVTWSSSDEDVVTVNSAGEVVAVSAGTATITVWASDGEHYATCSVTVQASTPHQASSLVVTGQDVTIQLTSQHITYSVPTLETMEIRDDMGYPILTNGEWLIGNGVNGIPDGVSAKDYYEITLSLSYDTAALPDMIRSMFSLDWENDQFVLDYSTTTHTCVGTCSVPIMWSIRSSLGNYSCMSEIIIKGEE